MLILFLVNNHFKIPLIRKNKKIYTTGQRSFSIIPFHLHLIPRIFNILLIALVVGKITGRILHHRNVNDDLVAPVFCPKFLSGKDRADRNCERLMLFS
jgi:hypothetical protein